MDINNFDPNGIGLNNGNFIGLPFSEDEAKIILLSVPWDVTVSYADGTSLAPNHILRASLQLDLFQPEINDAWKLGIYMRPPLSYFLNLNNNTRLKAKKYISFLESGGNFTESKDMQTVLAEINASCEKLNSYVYEECIALLKKGKLPAVVGGEHSTPLGLMHALYDTYGKFGVLHIDAHMDLRNSYEGFTYSHASIFNNAITNNYISELIQVGIRDYCNEEMIFAQENNIRVFYDDDLKTNSFNGMNWHQQCQKIISLLPNNVYVSFDIDGLNPHLCPNTGTPVPGGLEYAEALYLIKELVKSGRKIIGFDLCEVGGENEWDANVGARILYFLSNWAGRSQGWI